MRVKLEVDFTQHYGRNLQDLWDPKEKMTFRWVVVHAVNLPESSRVKMAARKDTLTQDQHIALDVVELLNHIRYFTIINAQVQVKPGEFDKILKGAPKPISRTNKPEKKEKPTFLSGRQLKELMGGVNQTVAIVHTNACMKGKIYANTGRCDCPREEASK